MPVGVGGAETPRSKLRRLSQQQLETGGDLPMTFRPANWAHTIFLVLEDPNYHPVAGVLSGIIFLLIVGGCATFIMETIEAFQYIPSNCDRYAPSARDCERRPLPIFGVLESACMYVFTVEYLARLVLVHTVPEEVWDMGCRIPGPGSPLRPPLKRTLAYARQPMNMIDCVAILPFWIKTAGLTENSFGVLRIIRLTRVFRMMRSPSIAASVAVFADAIAASMPALSILFFFSIMAFVLGGSLIFLFEQGTFSTNVEHASMCCDADDRGCLGCYVRPTVDGLGVEPSPFVNIPISMYWVIVTMTTVGYGDLYPTSTLGRLLAVVVVYTGVLAIALPITVIGNNFNRQYAKVADAKKRAKIAREKTRVMAIMRSKSLQDRSGMSPKRRAATIIGRVLSSMTRTRGSRTAPSPSPAARADAGLGRVAESVLDETAVTPLTPTARPRPDSPDPPTRERKDLDLALEDVDGSDRGGRRPPNVADIADVVAALQATIADQQRSLVALTAQLQAAANAAQDIKRCLLPPQ